MAYLVPHFFTSKPLYKASLNDVTYAIRDGRSIKWIEMFKYMPISSSSSTRANTLSYNNKANDAKRSQ